MKPIYSAGIIFLAMMLLVPQAYASSQADSEKWQACDTNTDCTSIAVGCWHWEPVNKKYTEEMKAANFIPCKKSVDPGPQPTSSCVAHMCVNDPYVVTKPLTK